MRRLLLSALALLLPWQMLSAEDLTVAAAADLNYALKELAATFEKNTSNTAKLSFGASGNLFAQIQNGAPYDLFFSADEDYPKKLAAAGAVDSGSLRTYAIGHLVLWVPRGVGLDRPRLMHGAEQIADILQQPSIRRIAIANPKTAPYGRAAMDALERMGVKQKVEAKLVFGENVSQAAQFAQSGNAQAGLIPLSLALSPPMKNAGTYWELPAGTYPEMRQVAAVVAASRHKKAAQAFLDYVTSAAGGKVLAQYGFQVPAAK